MKIKSHGNEVKDFSEKIPKLVTNHTCLAVISLNSALKKDGYYLQMFLKECKHIEKNVIRHIIDKVLLLILIILMKSKLKT